MANYFNTLSLREKLNQLGVCEFMNKSEFTDGVNELKGKKIVIVGCGAQGLNQGLNLRDSGLDITYALRQEAIDAKRQSWKSATENNFTVGTYEALIPSADLVINLSVSVLLSVLFNAYSRGYSNHAADEKECYPFLFPWIQYCGRRDAS